MSRPDPREVARARATLRDDRKARKAMKLQSFPSRPFPKREKATHGRERDRAYLAWLHDDLPCIACLIMGEAAMPRFANPIEAAHQKIQAADKGLHRKLGVKADDWQCVPLCAWHHRTGPLCCDPAQGKFWAILGVGDLIADFCIDLYAAFKVGAPGGPVIHRYGDLAAANRRAA